MMTPDEHKLVLGLFAKQLQQVKVIIEVLKSRGLLEGDDTMAFASVVHTDPASNALVLQQAKALYLEIARYLKIETGLENPPAPPNP